MVAEDAALERVRLRLDVNPVRVWCCDREEDELDGRLRSLKLNYRKKVGRGCRSAFSQSRPSAPLLAITCGELTAAAMQRVGPSPAAASSLVYTTANSTRHADMTGRPRTFLDIDINGEPAGRLVFELFTDQTPRTCEKYGIKWREHGNAGMLN